MAVLELKVLETEVHAVVLAWMGDQRAVYVLLVLLSTSLLLLSLFEHLLERLDDLARLYRSDLVVKIAAHLHPLLSFYFSGLRATWVEYDRALVKTEMMMAAVGCVEAD